MSPREIFLTGATGFLGSSLAAELLRRGHRVRALVRPGSESRVPAGMRNRSRRRAARRDLRCEHRACRYVRSSRRSRASQPEQGRGVSQDRPGLLPRSRERRQAGGHPPLRLSQRGPSRSHDEGVPGSARRRRSDGHRRLEFPQASCVRGTCSGPEEAGLACCNRSTRWRGCSRRRAKARTAWRWSRWSR